MRLALSSYDINARVQQYYYSTAAGLGRRKWSGTFKRGRKWLNFKLDKTVKKLNKYLNEIGGRMENGEPSGHLTFPRES